MIREHTDVRLMVSDEFTPASARSARAMGIDTIVTPSNLYEQAADPLALAREFYAALLAGRT
jgi:thiazole synthase ThiGH ThiG subunit